MNIILFDDPVIRMALLPFTFTRPVAEIRVGILTIADKWRKRMEGSTSFYTADYLSKKYPFITADTNVWINGACCPNRNLTTAIHALQDESILLKGETIIAARTKRGTLPEKHELQQVLYNDELTLIDKPWKIFKSNAGEIKMDFDLMTRHRTSEPISDPYSIIYGKENIFVEAGASIKAAIINAETGPVYIGKNSIVNEGSIIRGPFALCEGAQLSMGAKMRGDTTIGPHCRAGGEISNSILFGYSNKSHDGYLGNSVIGEWCNLGADTNSSNLKNNYSTVKLWNYAAGALTDTGEPFCGLMMGDHSKCGINTMFNTGTVVGVATNVFGAGFPKNFIPSFSWGGASGFTTYKLDKAHKMIETAMQRRDMLYETYEHDILKSIFELTAENRFREKNEE